ncbi:MAG: 4-hydroxy-3-methylbut-2-enyl diphosphate reductase [Pseudomonadota bacterium]|nr:4-hydroxy-3-methylbut-2-enyl diphosphate reductase [Pseudomonadota bacterium]
MKSDTLKIILAEPRGFCAGVDRAIEIVERALAKFGRPVYVRHEIVHNRHVVNTLRDKGAIFVEELSEVPEDVPVVFSAHGVPKSVISEATNRKMIQLDATCPLVKKVHVDAERHKKNGKVVLLIGHSGHPEVTGTLGQLAEGDIILVENKEQAETVQVPGTAELSFITQTTLSIDDTKEIISVLQTRFPHIQGPRQEDICYATTNRQAAVKALAKDCDALIVIGAPNSSNSRRLAEVGNEKTGMKSILIQEASELEQSWLDGVKTLGVTAGASAPEILVQELINWLSLRYTIDIETVRTATEEINFSLPTLLKT